METDVVPRETIFYDGECGLCHRFVRLVLARDGERKFQFAPQQGEAFRKACPGGAPAESIIVRTADGTLLSRSRAVLHVLRALGGRWRFISHLAAPVPMVLLDHLYALVARVRYRIFGRRDCHCPVLSAQEKKFFDLRG